MALCLRPKSTSRLFSFLDFLLLLLLFLLFVLHRRRRFAEIKSQFAKHFNCQPDFYARSPGRVNLIGEHIDYSDYSVLPMALTDKDIVIAVKTTTEHQRIRVANLQPDSFPLREFPLESKAQGFVQIDATQHEWSNYFKSGLKVCFIIRDLRDPLLRNHFDHP